MGLLFGHVIRFVLHSLTMFEYDRIKDIDFNIPSLLLTSAAKMMLELCIYIYIHIVKINTIYKIFLILLIVIYINEIINVILSFLEKQWETCHILNLCNITFTEKIKRPFKND